MPTNIAEPHPNYGPIAGRTAPVPASYLPPVSQHEEIAAGQLANLLDAGDEGAARHFVHQLEHGLAAWTVTPWRFLDALLGEFARRAPDPGPIAQESPAAQDLASALDAG